MRDSRNTRSYVSTGSENSRYVRNQSKRRALAAVKLKREASDVGARVRSLMCSTTGSSARNTLSICDVISASLTRRTCSATYALFLHVDDERPPAQAADAEKMHVLGAAQFLRRLRHVRALHRRGHERLYVVCKEGLERWPSQLTCAADMAPYLPRRQARGRSQSSRELRTE
jgi:hypothetical protein